MVQSGIQRVEILSFLLSEVQRALRFLNRPARHAMSINHRGPDIRMPEKRLNGGRCGSRRAWWVSPFWQLHTAI